MARRFICYCPGDYRGGHSLGVPHGTSVTRHHRIEAAGQPMETITRQVKKAAASIAVRPMFRSIFTPLVKNRVAVFMLHRFDDAELGVPGESPAHLRALLQELRRERIPIHPLRDVLDQLLVGRPVEGVAFTVDDGYLDFDRVGATVFLEFDAPVTVFVTSGYLDGRYWFWWDKILYAIERTEVPSVGIPGRAHSSLPLRTTVERRLAATILVEWVKGVPEDWRASRIEWILSVLDVAAPIEPPIRFQPMGWDRVRLRASQGIDFGPHTVHHPSVAGLTPDRIQAEVRQSYDRLRQELHDPLPVFCYPFGRRTDVSQRAADVVAAEGMKAAFTAMPGYVGLARIKDRFLPPRFALPARPADFRQIVHGFERFKEVVRGRSTR